VYYAKKRVHPSLGMKETRLTQQLARKRLIEIIDEELKEKLEQIKSQTNTVKRINTLLYE